MRYAHQYGRGTELSPFFYVDDKRTYFVEPLPDAPLPRLTVPRPTAGFALRATTTAPPASATNAVNTTHYQQTINNQIIDRGMTSVTIGSDQLADLGDILADDPAPAVVFEHSTVTTTGFRYQFTRFYHPYTCTCLKQLSRHGVDGLLNPDPALDADSENLYRQLTPRETFDFAATYAPDSQWTLENYGAEELDERIDFNPDSPHGPYNWELFLHIPLLVASKLMQNQRYDEARRWLHYVFDPRHNDGDGPSRFWKIKPFYQAQLAGPTETLQELLDLLDNGSTALEHQVQVWEQDPFCPDAIARLRISAYMQATVRRYLDCLIGQGDGLFLRETREYLNEAKLLYLLAAEILGERPTSLPAQEPPTLTANVLLDRYQATLDGGLREPFLDPLDLLVKVLTTTQSGVASRSSNLRLAPPSPITDQIFDSGINLPTTTPAPGGTDTLNTLLLFCLPENDVLARYWVTVADRMFKIRHCMDLSGQVRQLALFSPPIDPALLVRAASAGLEIQAVVASLFESLPHYRFNAILPKAIELCADVRPRRRAALGDAEPRRRGAVAPQEHPRTGGARVDQVGEAEGGRGDRRGAGGAREEQGVGRLQARLLFDPGTRQQWRAKEPGFARKQPRLAENSRSGRASSQRQQHHSKRLDRPDVGLGVVRRIESRRRRSGECQRLQGDGERGLV